MAKTGVEEVSFCPQLIRAPLTHGLKWTVQLGGAPLPATHYHSGSGCAGVGWTASSGPGTAS